MYMYSSHAWYMSSPGVFVFWQEYSHAKTEVIRYKRMCNQQRMHTNNSKLSPIIPVLWVFSTQTMFCARHDETSNIV